MTALFTFACGGPIDIGKINGYPAGGTEPDAKGGDVGSGGSQSSGGATNSGGATASGGTEQSGGATSAQGGAVPASGGTMGQGGSVPSASGGTGTTPECSQDSDCTMCSTFNDPTEVGCYIPCCETRPKSVAQCSLNWQHLMTQCGGGECLVLCSQQPPHVACVNGVCTAP